MNTQYIISVTDQDGNHVHDSQGHTFDEVKTLLEKFTSQITNGRVDENNVTWTKDFQIILMVE